MGQCASHETYAEWDGEKVDAIASITYFGCLIAAGAAAAFATLLSLFLIYKHLTYYSSPYHQRYIIRVLLMCPFYAIDSWLSFRWPKYAVYFDVVRDCYEAFVIYNFFLLLLNSLGGMAVAQKVLMGKRIVLPFPFNCIKFTATGTGKFLTQCKNGMLQYVVIRPVTTLVACFSNAANVYCPTSLAPVHVMFYTSGTNFISVSVAMYALIAFYYAVQKDLSPVKPLPKFLSIKFVIFFSFWQGCVISGLMKVNLLRGTVSWTADDIGVSVQSFLICVEMLAVAVLHVYAFDYEEYKPAGGRKSKIWKSIKHVCSLKDLLVDLRVPIHKFKSPEQIEAERQEQIRKARERVSMQMHLVDSAGTMKVVHSDGHEEVEGGRGGAGAPEPSPASGGDPTPKGDGEEVIPSYFDVSAYRSIQAHELSDGLDAMRSGGRKRPPRQRRGEEEDPRRRAPAAAPAAAQQAPHVPRRRGSSPTHEHQHHHHAHRSHHRPAASSSSESLPGQYNPFAEPPENPFAAPEPARANGGGGAAGGAAAPGSKPKQAASNPFLGDMDDVLI
eukprot:tig00021350_g20625.t1